MNSLLSILSRLSSYPHQLHTTNAWFMVNSYIYYFKLFNHLTFFTYISDSLKLNTIRVYNKQISGAFVLSFLVKFALITLALAMF